MSNVDTTPSEASRPPANKHCPKRTSAQRAADALFIEKLHLRGRTHAEIAELLAKERPYALSRSQISHDLERLKRTWMEAALSSFAASRATALRKLDALESEAWASWDATADATFAIQIVQVEERRAKLLGLDAPVKYEISGPEGSPILQNESRRQSPDAVA